MHVCRTDRRPTVAALLLSCLLAVAMSAVSGVPVHPASPSAALKKFDGQSMDPDVVSLPL